ncbi:MAG: hypothetical protein ACI9VR_003937, partial [Cognaticolwellia sp.]
MNALLLLACTRPVVSEDAALFASALKQLGSPEVLFQCGLIHNASTRADCQTQVVLQRGDGSCGAVDPGLYRDECYFHSAEQANRVDKRQEAARLCRNSAGFAADCQQHLWQSSLRSVMQRDIGFPRRYEMAHELYCEWQPILGTDQGFDARFWDRGWNSAMSQQWRVDISRCATLSPSQRERCEKGGAHLLAGKLDDELQSNQAREDLCESGSTGTVEFAEHVLLERVLDRHKEAVCERGLDRPTSRSA